MSGDNEVTDAETRAAPRLSVVSDAGLARFNTLVRWSFSLSAAIFLTVAACGYLTFGGASAGNILANYAIGDRLAGVARIAIGVSLLAGYPLAFASLQSSVYNALGGAAGCSLPLRGVSFVLLSLITVAACLVRDLGFVSAFAGALLGSAIIYVLLR